MVINNKTKIGDLLKIAGIISLAIFVLYLPSLLNKAYFVGGGDVRTQTYPFYIMYRRHIVEALNNRTLPFYAWEDFLGSNLWASKSLYGFFDIYTLISYFFGNNFYLIYDISCFIKVLLAGWFFYFYALYIFKDRKWLVVASVLYGLSNYALYFTSVPYFLSFYSLLPLYLLGVEKYLNEDKKAWFTAMTAVMLMNSFYLFFTVSVFLPIYFVYRYYNINKTLKSFFISALKLIGYYLIGNLLAGVVILPTVMYTMQNDRVGGIDLRLFFSDIRIYLHGLIASFVPTATSIYGNNVFEQESHAMKELCVYTSALIPLIIGQIFATKDKIFKCSTLILYVVLSLFLFTPVGGSIFHGLSQSSFRWTFLLSFVHLLVTLQVLHGQEQLNRKVLCRTELVYVIVVAVCFGLALISLSKPLSAYYPQLLMYIVVLAIMFAYGWLLLKNKEKAITILLIAELCFVSVLVGIKNKATEQPADNIDRITKVLADDSYQLNDYLDYLDETNYSSYYRVYIPFESVYWQYSKNMNKIYDLQGLMTYDSTFAPSFVEMRDMAYEQITGPIGWDFDIQNKDLIRFLSTKYAIVYEEDAIPFDNYTVIDPNYRWGLKIIQNDDYRPLGTTYSKVTTKTDPALINDYVICSEDDLGAIRSQLRSAEYNELHDIYYYGNTLGGVISSDDDSLLVIGLPYDKGWKILVNGIETTCYEVNGGMIGVPIAAGDSFIEMYFVPQGFKLGLLCSGAGVLGLLAVIFFDLKRLKTDH